MTSIMTNTEAMAALQTLRGINKGMETVQSRISSGYRVETAADNAAYWSIATTMRSDNQALSTVGDALGLGAAKVDVAYTGLNNAIKVVNEIKAKLVAASEPGVDKTKINSELTQLKNQLKSTAESASFSGENWLYNPTGAAAATSVKIVSSFNRAADGKISVGTLDVNVSATILVDRHAAAGGILTKDVDADALLATPTGTAQNWFLINATSTTAATGTEITLTGSTTDAQVGAMTRVVDSILTQLTDAASSLGAVKSRVTMQSEFVSNLMDAINKGVGRLVDADMNQESTRLKALQTQQQLGIQALSIANNSSQNILSLFRQ